MLIHGTESRPSVCDEQLSMNWDLQTENARAENAHMQKIVHEQKITHAQNNDIYTHPAKSACTKMEAWLVPREGSALGCFDHLELKRNKCKQAVLLSSPPSECLQGQNGGWLQTASWPRVREAAGGIQLHITEYFELREQPHAPGACTQL